jgi:uncharacterized membrane protein
MTLTRLRTILRWLLAAAFVVAGLAHIARPDLFLRITPAWVPVPRLTIVLTGWCELAGAIGLLVPRTRRLAAALLALYAVCVFPANIKHALDYGQAAGLGPGWAYHLPRLLFQPVIVWACLFAGCWFAWPFTAESRAARPLAPPRPPAPRA